MKLKTLIASLGVLFAVTMTSRAQDVNLGLKLGADMSQISGLSLNKEFNAYFFGGVQAQLVFGKLGLQLDGLLTRTTMTTGANFKDAFEDYIHSASSGVSGTDVLLTELSFPLAVDYRILGPVRVEAGVQYSLIINAKDKNDFLIKPKDVFEKGYASALVGAKVDLLKFQVGLRYLQGVQDINATDVPERWRTGRFQLSLSYFLF